MEFSRKKKLFKIVLRKKKIIPNSKEIILNFVKKRENKEILMINNEPRTNFKVSKKFRPFVTTVQHRMYFKSTLNNAEVSS